MAGQYDTGDVARCSVTFKDLTGTTVDPSTVVLEIKLPDGSLVTYTYLVDAAVVKDALGKYHVDHLLTQGGIHYYKWTGSGTVYAAEESQFFVKISQF